jgi:hypothetical protein
LKKEKLEKERRRMRGKNRLKKKKFEKEQKRMQAGEY